MSKGVELAEQGLSVRSVYTTVSTLNKIDHHL